MSEASVMFLWIVLLVVATAVPLDRKDGDTTIRNVAKTVRDETANVGVNNKRYKDLLTFFWTEGRSVRNTGDLNNLKHISVNKVFQNWKRIFKRQVFKTFKKTNYVKEKMFADERFEQLKQTKDWIWKHYKIHNTEAKNQGVKRFLLKKLALSHSLLFYQTSLPDSYKQDWKHKKHRTQPIPPKTDVNSTNVNTADVKTADVDAEKLECHYLKHFRKRWVLMIANCPRSFTNETLRAQCEHRQQDKVGNVVDVGEVPVQMSSGLVYRNLFCAICNGVKNIEAWDVNVVCNGVSSLHFVDGSAQFTLLGGASDGNKCQKTLVPKINDKIQLCVMTKRRSYQHFAMDNDLSIQPSETIAYPVSFSILMNFGFDGKTHILFSTTHEEMSTNEQPRRCSLNEVYNPDYNQCQQVVCPPGYILSGKSCNPDSNISAKPPTSLELETLNSVDELDRPALIKLQVNVSHSEVKDIMDPVFQNFIKVSLCDLLNITCERIQNFKMKPLAPDVTITTEETPDTDESSTKPFEYTSSAEKQPKTEELSESVVPTTVSTSGFTTETNIGNDGQMSSFLSTPSSGLASETHEHDGYPTSPIISEVLSTFDLTSDKQELGDISTSLIISTVSSPVVTSTPNEYSDHPASPFMSETPDTALNDGPLTSTIVSTKESASDLASQARKPDGTPKHFSKLLQTDKSTSSDLVNVFSVKTSTSVSTSQWTESSTIPLTTTESLFQETPLLINQKDSTSDVLSVDETLPTASKHMTVVTNTKKIASAHNSDETVKDTNSKRQVVVVEMSFVLLPPKTDVGHGEGNVTNVMMRIKQVIRQHKFTLSLNGTQLQVINMDNREEGVVMDAFCSRGIKQVYFDDEFDLMTSHEDNVTVVYVRETHTEYRPGMYDLTVLFAGNVQKTPNLTDVSGYVFVCVMPRIANSSCGRLNYTENDYTLLPNKSIIMFNRLYTINEYDVIGEKQGNIEICVPDEFYARWNSKPNMLVVHGCDKGFEHFLKAEGYLTATLGRVSIIALTTVLFTYVLMKKLRNLPGVNTMNLTFALLVTEVIFILGEGTELPWLCSLVAMALHYFILASFFWMNVMTFDVFKTFANKCILTRVRSKSKFMWRYSLYAWGSPLIIVGICAFLEFTGIIKEFQIGYGGLVQEMNVMDTPNKTLIANQTQGNTNNSSDVLNITGSHKKTKEIKSLGCWIQNPVATLIVFGGPMLVIFIVNGFLFIRTILCIQETAKMAHINTRRSSISHKTGRYDVMLYVRMSTVMGFTWIFGLASSIVSGSNAPPTEPICYTVHTLSILFTVFNCSQGLFILFAFVAKRRVFNAYKDLSIAAVREFKNWKEKNMKSFHKPSSSNSSSTCSSTTTISHVS